MKLLLPAIDEANHAGTRKLPAIAAAFALLGLILLLIYLEVLPLPKTEMTAALLAYAGTIALTTWAYRRWGFRSNKYRALLLIETLVLLSGFAVAMADNPPGLPILWAFYLLLAVLTAQDVGANRLALAVVLFPVSMLLAYKFVSDAAFDPRHYSYTISCGLLSAALFVFFGKNKESQLALMAHQMETERALSAARASLEAEQARMAIEAENRRLVEQMVVADKLGSMGLLAAGIAHEVNNPLSYVMGNVEYLLQSDQIGAKAAAALADVDKGLQEIASIIADLRGFSYSSAFSYRQTCDLREIVTRAQRLVAAEIKPQADLRLVLPDEPVYVRCQAERIQQVIVNLLMNASQALLDRPRYENRIVLTLCCDEGNAEIRVEDNGVGMSEDTKDRIFNLFYTTKPAGKGTGLVLSIAYRIAEDHHGSLAAQSKLGQGSTFVLRLPRVTAHSGRELRVLVVDDEERTLALYSRALEKFHVTTANCVGAAQALLGNDYDAVLCDVRLGDGLGFTLYERAPKSLRDRFVFYSALPADAPDLSGLPEGVPLLQKPLSLERVEQALLQAAGGAGVVA